MKAFTWVRRWAVVMIVVSLVVPLTGCDGEDENAAAPAVDITGIWDEVYTGTDSTGTWSSSGTMTVSQTGSAVSGTYSAVGGDNTGTLSGVVLGSTAVITFSPSNTSTFEAHTVTATITGNSGDGSWANSSTGRGGGWTATKR